MICTYKLTKRHLQRKQDITATHAHTNTHPTQQGHYNHK